MNINAQTVLIVIWGTIALWFLLKKGSILPFAIPFLITFVVLASLFGVDTDPDGIKGIVTSVAGFIVAIGYGLYHYRRQESHLRSIMADLRKKQRTCEICSTTFSLIEHSNTVAQAFANILERWERGEIKTKRDWMDAIDAPEASPFALAQCPECVKNTMTGIVNKVLDKELKRRQ